MAIDQDQRAALAETQKIDGAAACTVLGSADPVSRFAVGVEILRQAGQPSNAQATPAGSMVSTGLSLNPFSPITSAFGTDLTHIAIRLGLILLGGALVILGLVMMNEKRAKAVLRTGAEAALVAPK